MKHRKNVLHVVPALASRYGGPSVAAIDMCRALRTAGASTLLAATDADGASRLPVAVGTRTEYDGVPAIFFPRIASESYKWSPGLAAWLRRHVTEFDVVHVHAVFSHASVASGRACEAAGVPYIVRPLGTIDPWSLSRHRIRKQVLLRCGVRRLLEGAEVIHYTSEGERQGAEAGWSWLPRGIVVPLAVDEAFFSAGTVVADPRGPYVLALSRLDPKKGVDLLIEAFHMAATAVHDRGWRLVVAGTGDDAYEARLRALAHEGPARDRIEFRGWVADDERIALVQGAELPAAPSQQENFGIAIVEALASAVPVLVTPGVNLADEIERAGAGWRVPRTVEAVDQALRTAM